MDLKQRNKAGLALPLMGGEGERKPLRRKADTTTQLSLFAIAVVLISMLVGAGGTYVYFFRVYLSQHDAELVAQQQLLQSNGRLQHHRQEEFLENAETLQAKITALTLEKTVMERKLQESTTGTKDTSEMKKRLDVLVSYKQKTIGAIQKYSKQQLLQKYGPGPHYVELQVQFDPDSNVAISEQQNKNKDHMIWELASEDYMPHTVYWFLEQIDAKMYHGTSFHRNAGHVIQAGPAPNFLSPPNAKLLRPFRLAGLDGVLFQEYSDKYPHVKYTVGYAGRPGGPDFYVSMQDNTKNHGPGGQGSYADPGEADPCFATVVQGKDVADRIHKSEVKPGDYKHMQHNVAITAIRLVKYDPVTKTIEEDSPVEEGGEEKEEEE
jgi:cyclophilin family peptidyl-prolyl cis-trans isomerase